MNDDKVIHNLKIEPCFYEEILKGEKKFEVLFNDRGYKKGDLIYLMEHKNDEWTRRTLKREIEHIHCGLGMADGYVVLGLK